VSYSLNSSPRKPNSWNEAEARRLRDIHQGEGENRVVVRSIRNPSPDLTDRDRMVIFESLCARYDELKRMPNGYDFERGNKIGMAEVVDLAAKLRRMGIVLVDLEDYAR
jgi:hypothetical protein